MGAGEGRVGVAGNFVAVASGTPGVSMTGVRVGTIGSGVDCWLRLFASPTGSQTERKNQQAHPGNEWPQAPQLTV